MTHGADDTFTGFVQSERLRLFRYAYMLTRSVPEAEDLVQTALTQTYAHWPEVEQRDVPIAYVLKAISNGRVSSWRQRHRPDQWFRLVRTAPDDLATVDSRLSIVPALMKLPENQRKAVLLRHYFGYSEKEVAETLGWKIGTVKSQTARAIARLRQEFSHLEPSDTSNVEGEWRLK